METREEILQFLRDNRQILRTQYHVSKIALFGSFARMEQGPDSDVDLVVELDAEPREVHKLKEGLRAYLTAHLHRAVDLARERYLRPYAREHVLREAVYV
jgi:predicted nucleotidyltransferase